MNNKREHGKEFFAKASELHRSKIRTIVKSVFIDVTTIGIVGFSI
jgi:hypothetical protein